jgi:N-acylglucosamine-6-phosphate 2-epimerase
VTPVRREVIARLRGQLIVSCQAAPGSPLRHSSILAALARCAVLGGAGGIRADGPEDVAAIRRAVDVPLIGLYKRREASPVYITPTVEDARRVAQAGADIIAVQATRDRQQDADPLDRLIATIHREWGLPVLADVSTVDEGEAACAAGADLVATTMAGYTPHSRTLPGPDLELVRELARAVPVPVLAEGRIRTPEEAALALQAGAWAVVVGRAITMPEAITARFVEALRESPAGEEPPPTPP